MVLESIVRGFVLMLYLVTILSWRFLEANSMLEIFALHW